MRRASILSRVFLSRLLYCFLKSRENEKWGLMMLVAPVQGFYRRFHTGIRACDLNPLAVNEDYVFNLACNATATAAPLVWCAHEAAAPLSLHKYYRRVTARAQVLGALGQPGRRRDLAGYRKLRLYGARYKSRQGTAIRWAPGAAALRILAQPSPRYWRSGCAPESASVAASPPHACLQGGEEPENGECPWCRF